MPNALTLGDMSPRLRKVVGRESPRVTSTEEPDGGNLLVRIWRGAGVGNLPAYSTSTFCAGASGAPPWEPPRTTRWLTRTARQPRQRASAQGVERRCAAWTGSPHGGG